MTDATAPGLSRFETDLRRALSGLAPARRDDIVAEALSHVEARVAAGVPPDEAVAAFGDPRALAAEFRDVHGAAPAPWIAAVRRAAAGLAGASALLAVAPVAALAVLFAVLEALRPDRVGLWRAGQDFAFGFGDAGATEVLGPWVWLVLAAAFAASAFVLKRGADGVRFAVFGTRHDAGAASALSA